jgi:hypothetical protein
MSLVAANWFAFTSICFAIGGTALIGEIAGADYLVRLNPRSDPTAVSRTTWLFSLIHGAATLCLTPLIFGSTFLLGTPRWSRGVVEWIAFIGSLLISFAIVVRMIFVFLEWGSH